MIVKNMLDLRVSNRAAILKLLYNTKGLSRKEIASRLNLTPAAISYIVSDMLNEGILTEKRATEQNNRLGPREIILKINAAKFRVLCAYIPARSVSISCADLAGNIYFSKSVQYDTSLSGKEMLEAICTEMRAYIDTLSTEEKAAIIGAGFGLKGICDNKQGDSINSFGLWENNLPVKKIATECLGGINVLVDNDIRCIANAEMLFGPNEVNYEESVLFIKYGPLVGSAFMLNDDMFCGHSYRAMELAHYVIDPLGSICRCGKRGCLETVVGFDVMISTLKIQYSKTRMPLLYKITGGSAENINADHIVCCYEHGEAMVVNLLDFALDRLALGIVNCVRLLDPKQIILYGFPFESLYILDSLKQKIYGLDKEDTTVEIVKSARNMLLGDLGGASVVIRDFISNGALYETFDPLFSERVRMISHTNSH